MKRILGILAILAVANSGFAQSSDSSLMQRPVQDMGGDGTQGLYGTPDYLSQHPNDTIYSNPGQTSTQQDQTNMQNANDTADQDNELGQNGDSYSTTNIWAGNYPTTTSTDPFFSFNNAGDPKEISKLGTDPEFPFLARLGTAQQEYRAMKKHAGNTQLNNIITSLGFANGVEDLQASNITAARIPGGTTGNMGAGNGSNGYYRLVGDNGFKAWKVTGNNGSYVFFLQACGNEFYPNSGKPAGTACVTAPVSVTAQPVSITANGQQVKITDKTYVYYHIKGRHHRHMFGNTNGIIADSRPSMPLLLNTKVREELVPETYQVTVATQDQNITVCPDSAANVGANINVEKTSSYTGNYPGTENKYVKVTKREYARAQRKMRKAERKEEKVARLTKTPVDTEESGQKNS